MNKNNLKEEQNEQQEQEEDDHGALAVATDVSRRMTSFGEVGSILNRSSDFSQPPHARSRASVAATESKYNEEPNPQSQRKRPRLEVEARLQGEDGPESITCGENTRATSPGLMVRVQGAAAVSNLGAQRSTSTSAAFPSEMKEERDSEDLAAISVSVGAQQPSMTAIGAIRQTTERSESEGRNQSQQLSSSIQNLTSAHLRGFPSVYNSSSSRIPTVRPAATPSSQPFGNFLQLQQQLTSQQSLLPASQHQQQNSGPLTGTAVFGGEQALHQQALILHAQQQMQHATAQQEAYLQQQTGFMTSIDPILALLAARTTNTTFQQSSLLNANSPGVATRETIIDHHLARRGQQPLPQPLPSLFPYGLSMDNTAIANLHGHGNSIFREGSNLTSAAPLQEIRGGGMVDSVGSVLPSQMGRPDANTAGPVSETGLIGRQAVCLYVQSDDDQLSPYQCLVRKQIELFEALSVDVESNAQGRNRKIVLGQVGIRCRHCARRKPRDRKKAAIFYPTTLEGVYQAAQNQAKDHLAKHCEDIPQEIRNEILQTRDRKSSPGGGKTYWAEKVSELGVYEDESSILRFEAR